MAEQRELVSTTRKSVAFKLKVVEYAEKNTGRKFGVDGREWGSEGICKEEKTGGRRKNSSKGMVSPCVRCWGILNFGRRLPLWIVWRKWRRRQIPTWASSLAGWLASWHLMEQTFQSFIQRNLCWLDSIWGKDLHSCWKCSCSIQAPLPRMGKKSLGACVNRGGKEILIMWDTSEVWW